MTDEKGAVAGAPTSIHGARSTSAANEQVRRLAVGQTSGSDKATYTSMDQVEQELFPRRAAARRRSCPTCGAGPGEPCIAAREQMPLRDLHHARLEGGPSGG